MDGNDDDGVMQVCEYNDLLDIVALVVGVELVESVVGIVVPCLEQRLEGGVLSSQHGQGGVLWFVLCKVVVVVMVMMMMTVIVMIVMNCYCCSFSLSHGGL